MWFVNEYKKVMAFFNFGSRSDLSSPFTEEQARLLTWTKVLEEEALSDDSLLDAINDLYLNRNSYIQSMEQSNLNNAVKTVVSLIESCVK